MPTPVDPKRLPALRAALKTFKPKDMAPQQELAKVYGVTNARLTTLIKTRFEDFPEAERRGDKTHWYNASAAIRSMIAYLEKSGKQKQAAAARAAVVMGRASEAAAAAEPEKDAPPPLGPAELDRLASASTRVWRLGIEQGKFVEAAKVRHDVRGMFEMFQRDISSLPHTIDPNGELPPVQRGRLEQRARKMLVNLYERMSEYLTDAQ